MDLQEICAVVRPCYPEHMLCSSLKTSDVLEVKAAEALAPGMVTTDVGGINEKSLISCFFRAKI